MGGTQTIVLPNGQEFHFDDREYYSGRGAKYNSSIRHDDLGRIEVTNKQVTERLKHEREMRRHQLEGIRKRKEDEKRYQENKKAGIYGLQDAGWTHFIELSDEESRAHTFDSERLARTLDISVEDANLLRSKGKTYVFAKELSTGRIVELYHASLFCNDLAISISYPTDEQIAQFDHDQWSSAPYADEVGQTSSKNHFVC